MPGTTDRTRWRARSRLLVLLMFAPCFSGCAAMTQDVDAYYRQMAFNFQEAADKAKLDEVALENESRVLGVTGDQSRYRKAQKQLCTNQVVGRTLRQGEGALREGRRVDGNASQGEEDRNQGK